MAVRDAGERLRALERRETDLHDRQEEVRRKADYLRHVVEEITRAAPKPGEDAALDIEAKRLTHADELGRLSKELEQTLEAAGFARAGKLLGSLQRVDASVAKWRELLDAIFANVAELTTAVRDYAAEIEADPGRLAAVEQRRDLLYRLQQKYGPSLPDVLATRDASAKELELLDTADLDLRSLAEERATAARDFERACAALTAKRQTGARHLEQAVHELLPALGMPEGRFAVRIIPRTTHPAQGAEAIVFEIQLNVGLDPRPLARVASGGELSRLMLALKVVLASHDARVRRGGSGHRRRGRRARGRSAGGRRESARPASLGDHAPAADRGLGGSPARRGEGGERRCGDERRSGGERRASHPRAGAHARRPGHGHGRPARRGAAQKSFRDTRITRRNTVAAGTTLPRPLTVCSIDNPLSNTGPR